MSVQAGQQIAQEANLLITPADADATAKILIVDDDERTLLAVTTVLEELGQPLVVARSGEEALRFLLHDDFAVILLDLHMPGMDGYMTAELIRARKRTRHIPIIFLTAIFRDQAHILQAYSAGAVDMVFKPVDPFILKSKVSVFIDLHIKRIEVQKESQERKRAEKQLALSEQQFRLLVAGDADYALYMLDPNGIIASWNAGVERIKGFKADEVVGTHFSRFYTEADREKRLPQTALEIATREGRYEAEGLRLRKDGTTFWANAIIDRIVDERNNLVGFAKITRDISERRAVQQKLEQSQKMEALGQLTGGIAHDFNNLLMIVSGHAQILAKRLREPKDLISLTAIQTAAKRGATLTKQLLGFARQQHVDPMVIDLGSRANEIHQLLTSSVPGNIEVNIIIPEDIWPIFLDLAEFELALVNLCVNARDAMPNGGTITLTAKNVDLRPTAGLSLDGKYVELSITDNGAGIKEEDLPKIFDPFFTTKDVGKGTGLGLSQVYGFAYQSGGVVTAKSRKEKGTTVTLYFPRSAGGSPEVAKSSEPEPTEFREYGRILLVEDNPDVAKVNRTLLEDMGYEVTAVPNAAMAIDLLNRDKEFDLLFSDIVMPGDKNGLELAKQVQKEFPTIPILLTSGYAKAADMAGSNFSILRKPFQQTTLREAIRHAITLAP